MIYPSTAELLRLLIGSVLLGVCFCLAYDLLRIARMLVGIGERPPSRLAVAYPRGMNFQFSLSLGLRSLLINLGDLLFFLLCGATLAVYFSAASHGRVRWLALAGLGGGFLLCRMSLSVLVLRFAGCMVDILRFLLAWAFWGICQPIYLLLRVCHRVGCLMGSVLFSLWLPRYTRWKMKRCHGQLRRFYQQKRRTHNGIP